MSWPYEIIVRPHDRVRSFRWETMNGPVVPTKQIPHPFVNFLRRYMAAHDGKLPTVEQLAAIPGDPEKSTVWCYIGRHWFTVSASDPILTYPDNEGNQKPCCPECNKLNVLIENLSGEKGVVATQ